MGKPRMIIVIRHAQSEGNQNREIHQNTPDHRVKLTELGWQQAHEAGQKLRSMLSQDDTLHFFTSPYRRTRETTEGILRSLTSDEHEPSPFPRQTIKVYEEPRLREQDFGNFQPSSKEMTRMWKERAEYGHFFFRIPNGESAADAYDRVSGFNESLWRSFGELDFASVCVLVTHGLMTRVFLMKWYHWSVEYFEDLRNIDHCEFVIMRQNMENGKYILHNKLRTWTEFIRERQAEEENANDNGPSIPMRRRWTKRQDTRGEFPDLTIPQSEIGDHASAPTEYEPSTKQLNENAHRDQASNSKPRKLSFSKSKDCFTLDGGRDGGGSLTGVNTPAEGLSDDSDYGFPKKISKQLRTRQAGSAGSSEMRRPSTGLANTLGDQQDDHMSDLDSPGAISKPEDEENSVRGSVY